MGDWYAGAWLPNDLNPVREYARQKGLLFGLWVEIESIGSASKLRQEHPDWVLTRNGKPVAGGRLLDVANPAVAAWMESEIARIIKKYDLDLFRHRLQLDRRRRREPRPRWLHGKYLVASR